MTYVKQTWANGPAGATPISADRLAYMEEGIRTASSDYRLDNPLYGGDPTGVLDSTAGLELAVAAAKANGGGKVKGTPGGTYRINAVTFSDLVNVEIDLHGTTVNSDSRVTLLTFENPSGVVVRAPSAWVNVAGATSAHLVYVKGGSGVRVVGRRRTGEIQNAGLIRTEAHPTTSARCGQILVERMDCDGANASVNLAQFAYTDHVEITRCSIRNSAADLIKTSLDTKYIKIEHNVLEGAGDEAFDLFGGGQFAWVCKNVFLNCRGGVNLKLDNTFVEGTFTEAAWCDDNTFKNCGIPISLLSISGGSCRRNKIYDCGQNPDGTFQAHAVRIVDAGREVAYENNEHVRTVSTTGVILWNFQTATVAGFGVVSRRSAVGHMNWNKFRDSVAKDIDLRLTGTRGRFLNIEGNEHYNQPDRCLGVTGTGGGTIRLVANHADHKCVSGWRISGATNTTRWIVRDNNIDRFYEVQVNATGGEFTLTLGGQTTSNLNAATLTAATLQTALEALSNVGVGVLQVGGGPASASAETAFLIIFNHDAKWGGGATPPTLTATNVSLTGGTSTITIAPTAIGANIFTTAGTVTVEESGNSWNGLEVGTTTQRPARRYTGQMYFDTTLGTNVIWNGSAWRVVTVT